MQAQYTSTLPKLNQTKRTPIRAVNLLLTLCIAALILLRDVGGVSLTRVVFIVLATLVCLLSDKSGIYCLLAFITPLAPGISTTYITAIALVILLFKPNLRLKVQIVGFICVGGILLMELLSAFRGMFSLIEYLRFTGIFVFSFLRTFDLQDDYDNEAMLHGYLLGFWIAMVSVLGQMLKIYSLGEFLGLGVRLGDTRELLDVSTEGMLVSYNANDLGFICVLASLFCLLLYRKNKKKWYLLSFFGATLLGIMTQSRSFLLVYTIGIVLYVIFSCYSVKTVAQSLLALAAGGAAILGGVMWLIPNYVANFIHRFQVDDLLNGRGSIAAYYFSEMFQHVDRLLFGVGLQNYAEKYGYYISAHNATQEVMIAWGLLGLVMVVLLFFGIFWNGHVRNPEAKLVQYLPLFLYLAAIQSGQGFSDTTGILLMMVAYSAILLPLEGGMIHSTESGKH